MPTASEDPAVRAKRPWIVLGFAVLTAGLIIARALGHEVDYELIILSGSIAGLDSVRSLVAQAGAAAVRKRSEPPAAAAPPAPAPTAQDVAAARAEAVAVAGIVAGLGGGGGMRPLREPLPYPLDDDDDDDGEVLVDAYSILSPELLAPALYGCHRDAGDDWEGAPAFAQLTRSDKARWHAVARLTLDLAEGDRAAFGMVLDLVADAAGGYLDSDPPAHVPPPSDGREQGAA
jgi:hypothetical protein